MPDNDDDVIVSDTDSDAGTETDDDAEPEGAADLGDAGKQALDRMKAERNKARAERRALAAELEELKKPKTDADNPEQIREQARAEARAEVLKDRALDRIEARAAKLFADPEDARALLAGHVDDFVDDGKIDVEAIQEALDDLLKRKPHLGATPQARFTGSADGGARKGTKPDQLSRDDLKRMTPDQIVEAKAKGRLVDLMGADS